MTIGWIISEVLGALFVIVSCVYLYFKLVVYNYWRKKGISSEEPSFPFGNVGESVRDIKSIGEIFKEIYKKYKSKPYIGTYAFFQPNLLINDPEVIRFVLAKEFSSFHDRGMYCNEKVDPLSGHLFLLPGKKWRNLRVRLTPTFTSGKIKQMYDTLQESTALLNQFLEKKARNESEMEIKEILSGFFTDIIVSIAFGIKSNCMEDPSSEFRYWGKKVFEPRRVVNALAAFTPIILDTFSIPFTDSGVSKFFIKAFEETVDYRLNNNVVRRDFLDLIIQLMKNGYVEADDEKRFDPVNNISKETEKLNTLEAAAQAYVFYLAGFETTSTTVTYCLYEMAFNQDIQRKLQEEIDATKKKHGSFTYNSINEMSYLHMVVSETLRKYPPVPILNRVCTKDIELPNTDIILNEGTLVTIPVFGIHMDPDIYPEPDKFIPERFTEENIKARHQYTYLPFGEGPRICIGMRFGLIQAKIALTNILSKFKVSPGPKTQRKLSYEPGSFVLQAKGGIHLRVETR